MRDIIIKKVSGIIQKHQLIRKCQKVFVSFSGGADSTALFYILNSLKHSMDCSLYLLHINHNIRPESDYEERWAIQFSMDNGVPLILRRLYPGGRDLSRSLEEWAHHERYRIYREIMENFNDSVIATAHHAGDNLETVLLSLFKGNIGNPLLGIKIRSGSIIRPLLHIKKGEILNFAEKFRLSFLNDPSNQDISHDRNFLRHRIIPGIEDRFPGIYAIISNLASRTAVQKDYFESVVRDYLLKHSYSENNAFQINITEYMNLHKAIQYEIIRSFLLQIYQDNKAVSHSLISEIVCHIEKRKGKVRMPGKLTLYISEDSITVEKISES